MTVRIGLLFSLTGTTSIVEVGQYRACLLAIEHANANYGLQFEPVAADIRSDPDVAAKAAHDLLKASKVDLLVGCYTSACRKSLIPVLSDTHGTLLYPTVYEGQESHPGIFYFGAVPNQQVDPLLSWSMSNISNRFVLVGSDYVYPRSINRQVRSLVERAGGSIVSEAYFPLGHEDFRAFMLTLKQLHREHPSLVVFSTLVGSSIPAFYRQHHAAGLPRPIVSPITSEVEFAAMGAAAASGHCFSDGYPDQIGSTSYRDFVRDYRLRFGEEPVNGIMMSAYDAVQLLARCHDKLKSARGPGRPAGQALRATIGSLPSAVAPRPVMMDAHSQHAWMWTRVGRVGRRGEIDVIWTSPGPMPPRPYGDRAGPSTGGAGPALLGRGKDPFRRIIGRDRRLQSCLDVARIAARTSSNILLTGETGTGKELFARAIHEASPRRHGPFVPINCAALPSELVASELFGYEGGSFTGAKREGRRGKFELADGGTLFLDEVAEMPVDAQGTLLRVLQDQQVFRIGGSRPVRVDVRVISAANRDIAACVRNNRFRRDLFYRLNVFTIELPPLRTRRDDILPIANHYLEELNRREGTAKRFAGDAIEAFLRHDWPGNVRELHNAIERAFHVSLDEPLIRAAHLPDTLTGPPAAGVSTGPGEPDGWRPAAMLSAERRLFESRTPVPLAANEKEFIAQAIAMAGLNMSRAARALGISRSTLYRKVRKLGIRLPRGASLTEGPKPGGR